MFSLTYKIVCNVYIETMCPLQIKTNFFLSKRGSMGHADDNNESDWPYCTYLKNIF